MSNRIQTLGAVVAIASIGSAMAATLIPQKASAQTKHAYSTALVDRYNSGCQEKLQARGHSPEKAKAICQCSLTQMQLQHNQTAAILVLTSAQLNPVKDPRIGLPTTLSKYFTPCLG